MPLKLASREYVHILQDAALLPLKGRYVIDIRKRGREKQMANDINYNNYKGGREQVHAAVLQWQLATLS